MNVLDAAANAVHDYPGGAPVVAMRMGNKSPSTLNHELAAQGTAKLGLTDAVKISRITGSTAIAQAFATELGGVFMPAAAAATGADLQALGRCAKEFGDLAAAFAQSVADGCVSANELHAIEREALEAIAAITALAVRARDLCEQAKPSHLRVAS